MSSVRSPALVRVGNVQLSGNTLQTCYAAFALCPSPDIVFELKTVFFVFHSFPLLNSHRRHPQRSTRKSFTVEFFTNGKRLNGRNSIPTRNGAQNNGRPTGNRQQNDEQPKTQTLEYTLEWRLRANPASPSLLTQSYVISFVTGAFVFIDTDDTRLSVISMFGQGFVKPIRRRRCSEFVSFGTRWRRNLKFKRGQIKLKKTPFHPLPSTVVD